MNVCKVVQKAVKTFSRLRYPNDATLKILALKGEDTFLHKSLVLTKSSEMKLAIGIHFEGE